MPSDLHELLDDAAREPQRPLDVDDIRRRARRSRRVAIGGAALVGVLLAVGTALAVSSLVRTESELPIIGDRRDTTPPAEGTTPPAEETETEPSTGVTSGPTVAPAELGTDVLVPTDGAEGEDGSVVVHHPDGSRTTIRVDTDRPSSVGIVPDDRGGFVWQPGAGSAGSPPILHVGPDGSTTTLVGPTTDSSETYDLVGGDGGQVLVSHRQGTGPDDTTIDLLGVDVDGGEPEPVVEGLFGWEAGIGHAAYLDDTVYTLTQEATNVVVVQHLDGSTTTVFEGGEATGEYAIGVARGDGEVFTLVDDASAEPPAGRVLVVDPFEGSVTETIDVPLHLGDADPMARAGGISADGGTILVNRTVGGEWLPPLVHDTGDGTWAVLDVTGRALLAQPSGDQAEGDSARCDTAQRRNAPPADGDTLDLYLGCAGQTDLTGAVYRFDSGIDATGDVATDARAILERLFAGTPPALADRGFYSLEHPQTGTISIRDVTFADGALTIGFDFPDRGVGNYSTSTGSMVWHQLLTANLLQFDQVQHLELLADGSCDGYSGAFEGAGCTVIGRDGAPWNEEP